MKKIKTRKKKLMILGGNPETRELVDKAIDLGVYTIVVDPNPSAPAKLSAHESYNIDAMDVDSLYSLAKELEVDGVLVGVADILVPSYYRLAKKLDLPTYGSKIIVDALCTKDGFEKKCKSHDIPTVPSFSYQEVLNDHKNSNIFPLIVKPVDNGGGIGMTVCWNANELKVSVKKALNESKKGRILIEKFMDCEDMFSYFTFDNEKYYLSAVADRVTTKKQGNLSPVCIGEIYPSKHINKFEKKINPLLQKFFRSLKIHNGVLNIQFFVKNNEFYAYDPGFRLQGAAPHHHINYFNGFDQREMLINFALGINSTNKVSELNDPKFKSNHAATIWVLLKSGTIGKIEGLDQLHKSDFVINIVQRFDLGDKVSKEMEGNERQVFARIYIQAPTKAKLKKRIDYVNEVLSIKNVNDEEMILDLLKSKDF